MKIGNSIPQIAGQDLMLLVGVVMDGVPRGRFRSGGWKRFDLLMLGLSIATVLWILIGH